ncbi:hypothetical protein BC826DRAFT_1025546 [Russula brevipes]|nr:hypothetical protein BC826DRAFT_1025546 [Russula brevipes]
MAYYPGNYYQRFPHRDIADYYAHGLFGGIPSLPPTYDIDPYIDSYHYDHDHPSPSHHRSVRPTHNTASTNSPPSSRPRPRPRTTVSPPPNASGPPREHPPQPTPPPRPAGSPSPPPPALPPSPAPSQSYLEFASTPSKALSSPTRKLLVLDLNGALLLRSPHAPKSARRQYLPHPAARRVMPRPYLPALRAYLFAAQTRAWLDVMVWSSAQPHSVEDMVLHAFGSDRDRLVAIWARDTLGLAEDHYHRKVQTIKDLEKPWALLEPHHPASPIHASSRTRTSASQRLPSSTRTGRHSAATTILLDDSHAKAARQPHNHLPVPEYTRARRNADLAAALALHAQRAASPRAEAEAPTSSSPPPPSPPLPPPGSSRKRKRKVVEEEDDGEGEGQEHAEAPAALDETLLAVVGILHAARLQSSVAGWLCAGALLSERGAPWCDEPALVRAWALRGRRAMGELRLEVEHGVKP